jgi:hypothetical protein
MEVLFNPDYQPKASLEGPDSYHDEDEEVDNTVARPKTVQA